MFQGRMNSCCMFLAIRVLPRCRSSPSRSLAFSAFIGGLVLPVRQALGVGSSAPQRPTPGVRIYSGCMFKANRDLSRSRVRAQQVPRLLRLPLCRRSRSLSTWLRVRVLCATVAAAGGSFGRYQPLHPRSAAEAPGQGSGPVLFQPLPPCRREPLPRRCPHLSAWGRMKSGPEGRAGALDGFLEPWAIAYRSSPWRSGRGCRH
jgi:hypothetical protein